MAFYFTQLYGLYLPQSAKNKDTKDIQLDNTYLYGDEDSNYFDKMFPILMSFFCLFICFSYLRHSTFKRAHNWNNRTCTSDTN